MALLSRLPSHLTETPRALPGSAHEVRDRELQAVARTRGREGSRMAAPRLRAEVRPGQGRAGLGWSHTGLSTWPALREQRVPPWLPILMLGRSPKPREFKGRWAVGRAWCPGRTWAGMHSSVDIELWKPARVLTGPEMRHTDAPHDGPRGPGPRRWRPLPGRQATVLPRQGSPRMTSLTGVCAGPPSRFRTTALAIRVRWPMFPRLMPPAALGVTGTIRAAAGPGSHPHYRSMSPQPRLRDAGFWRAPATWRLVTPSHSRPHDADQRTEAPRVSELTLHAPHRAALDRGPSPTPRCHRAALAPRALPRGTPSHAAANMAADTDAPAACADRATNSCVRPRVGRACHWPSGPTSHPPSELYAQAAPWLPCTFTSHTAECSRLCTLRLAAHTWPTRRASGARGSHVYKCSPRVGGQSLLANTLPKACPRPKRKPR